MNARHLGAAAALAVLGSVFASCATQEQYDEAVAQAKLHQTRLHECERDNARLQADVDRLKGALAMSDVNTVDSDYTTQFQSRISELQARIDMLNRPLKDVERFDVEGGYVLMIQDKILFASGSATLNPEGQGTVRQLARDIQSQPHGRVWVRGHTDSDPVSRPETKARFPHGNLQLSVERAVEVAALLISAGVGERDVAVAGFGPHDPVKQNSSAENKRLNRRVEIFVSDVGN